MSLYVDVKYKPDYNIQVYQKILFKLINKYLENYELKYKLNIIQFMEMEIQDIIIIQMISYILDIIHFIKIIWP